MALPPRKAKEKEPEYKPVPVVKEPWPDSAPNVKKSLAYLREKCEPLRGRAGAIAAFHILTVIDHFDNGSKPKLQLPERKEKIATVLKKKMKKRRRRLS